MKKNIKKNIKEKQNSKIKNLSNNKNNTSKEINLENIMTISKDCYANISLIDNSFCIFTSIDKIFYLVYSNVSYSIIFYNLIDFQKMNEIKNAHKYHSDEATDNRIYFRHHFDKNNERDLILSILSGENNLKIWNVQNLECLLNINNIYRDCILSSACFINYSNNINIVTANKSRAFQEPIKVFNLKGKLLLDLRSSIYSTIFIDEYYDNKKKVNYIIAGCQRFVRVYNYNKKELYNKYNDMDDEFLYHYNVIINETKDYIKMIEIDEIGTIRIWNFHSAQLLNKIKNDKAQLLEKIEGKFPIYGFCQWDNEHFFYGYEDGLMQIIFDFNKIKDKSQKKKNGKTFIRMKKIIHPKYGDCLITQEYLNGYSINLWVSKK